METTASGRARILFVDDEPRILLSLKAIFRGSYEIFTAESGMAALELLGRQPVDVIVSDQRMPQMTGVEMLKAARQLQPQAIRMLLTGYSDLGAIVGSINDGEIFRFINKPWSNDELRDTMAAAVQASGVEPLPPNDLPDLPASAPPARDVGIVVLTDEDTEREHLAGLLRGWAVHGAASTGQCIALLEQHRIGVIVSELQVGGEYVTDLLAALRQHQPALVSIVITDQADAGHAIDLVNRAQVYRLLEKPVDEGALGGIVGMATARFRALQSSPARSQRFSARASAPAANLEQSGLLQRIRNLRQA